jgi:apolipoprotein N-acyltransferase
MVAVRRFLWKWLGITLDRRTLLLIGAGLLSCLAILVSGVLLAMTGASFYRALVVLCALPAEALALGGCYRAAMWNLSSKSERREIEQEVALTQLKRRVQDKRYRG